MNRDSPKRRHEGGAEADETGPRTRKTDQHFVRQAVSHGTFSLRVLMVEFLSHTSRVEPGSLGPGVSDQKESSQSTTIREKEEGNGQG